ncbi:MAG: hypothetical protein ACTHLJ_02205 [Angustibacter sp.]
MSLTTDDLRDALAEAADAPYDAAGTARLHGVRTRVRRARQRRAAAVSGVGALAVAAVVAAVAFGGTRTATPAPASTTSGVPTNAAVAPAELPTTWGVREVVGSLTGSGSDTPGRLLTWPSQVTGVLVRCDRENSEVEISYEAVGKDPSTMSFSCRPGGDAFQVSDLSPAAARIRPGQQVRMQVRLDHSDTPESTTFGAGLLVGRDEIDMSTLRNAPAGWSSVGAYAMADGWQYSAYAPDGKARGTAITNGVQIMLADQRAARLQVRCSGAVRLDVDPGTAGEPTSVTCPAGHRSSQTVDVDLRPANDQRLTLRAVDAAPGALVEVGVATR